MGREAKAVAATRCEKVIDQEGNMTTMIFVLKLSSPLRKPMVNNFKLVVGTLIFFSSFFGLENERLGFNSWI